MTTTSTPSSTNSRRDLQSGILARALQIGIGLLIEVAVLFGGAGRFDWIWAWVFLGLYLAGIVINSAFLLSRSPGTVAERGRAMPTRGWDKWISGLWSLMQYLLIPLVAGLDMRFGWSGRLGPGWHVAGSLLFAAGLALFGWAMITNAYFSTAVRIQSERGQTVCRRGPYRIVRHPGYAGVLLQSAGTPLLLGSWWALIPAALAAGFISARTAFEDRALKEELPGYREFVQDVHYRLIPGVW
jgi:protein-S-isoprenylcysteine O-methyltransferase Ste14